MRSGEYMVEDFNNTAALIRDPAARWNAKKYSRLEASVASEAMTHQLAPPAMDTRTKMDYHQRPQIQKNLLAGTSPKHYEYFGAHRR